MKLFRLRHRAHKLGFLVLPHGEEFEITNLGTVKTERSILASDLEEIEKILDRLGKEEE